MRFDGYGTTATAGPALDVAQRPERTPRLGGRSCAARSLRADLRAHPAPARRVDDALRLRAGDPAPRPRRRRLHETPPRHALPARRFLFDDAPRLLPALLGRDGAAAAHGRRPGARGVRVQPRRPRRQARRVRRPRPRRALVGRGVLPALGWVTFDPTPGASPARSQSATPPTPSAPRARPGGRTGRRPGARAVGDRRSSAATPAPAARPAGLADCTLLGARRCSPLAGAVAALVVLCAPARRGCAPTSAELAELERALRRSGRPGAGDDARASWSERLRRRRAPARPTSRALRHAALRRAPATGPTREQRAGAAPRARRRARDRRAAARAGGRCRRGRAAPRPSRRVLHWSRLTMSGAYELYPQRHRAARARRLPRRRRAAARAPATWSPTRLGPRGARPRAVPRAALPRGRRGVRAPSSSARRPTTTRCSASAARCSCWAATTRRASRWRWRRACAPSGRTTGATASAPGDTPA